MFYNEEKLLKSCIQKMIRCVSMNLEKAFLLWKLELIRTKEKIFEIKKTQTITNFATIL